MEVSKVQKARAGLVLDEPFFATLALKLKLLEDPSCETGWTDGVTLGYNPEWVESLTLAQTKGFVAHEVMHPASGHHTRRQHREPRKYNAAADYAINPMLQKAGFELPPGAFFNPSFDGMYSEEIYNKIPDPPEGTPGDPGKCGGVRDAPGKDGQKPTQADLAEQEQDWKQAVAQAAQVAKKAGKLPAGMDRFVDEIINPKLDWREILRRFIDQNAKNDFSWSPPNKRYLDMGMYLPSLRSQQLPLVGLINDTSGSRTDQECCSEVAANLTAILEEYSATELVLLHVDTKVAGVERITKDDLPLRLSPKGGGGTSFDPGFQWLEENDIAPACVIYFTDLECSDYPEDPGYPTLWIHTGKGGTTPPFGEVIDLD